mmetsp:Transcript_21602/g.53297  ORF Transcript_21602/g.53297 Transcript_21602/m.53297 type:complete len:99 (-) Transcript_21602:123-419(-)
MLFFYPKLGCFVERLSSGRIMRSLYYVEPEIIFSDGEFFPDREVFPKFQQIFENFALARIRNALKNLCKRGRFWLLLWRSGDIGNVSPPILNPLFKSR